MRTEPAHCGTTEPGYAARTVHSLTALRGVAAWGVVLSHCLRLLETCRIAAPGWIAWLDFGDFSVLVFFCLGGFALVLGHSRDRWSGASLGRFLIRRVFRVYPGFLVSFVLCLAIICLMDFMGLFETTDWITDNNRIPSVAVALASLTLIANLFGMTGYVNNVFWSLPVEFQFYLMFPVLLVVLRRSASALAFVLLALWAASATLHAPGQTLQLVWVFGAGMLAGWSFPLWRAQARRFGYPLVAVVLTCVCLFENAPLAWLRLLPGPSVLYLGVLAILLVLVAAPLEVTRRGKGKWLISQGEMSYSLYLFHTPFILAAYVLLTRWQPPAALGAALAYVIVLPGSWAAAHLLNRMIERPGTEWGRKLSESRHPRIVRQTPGTDTPPPPAPSPP